MRIGNPCAAHRGASGLAPENTLAAMKLALSYPYVSWIELDVQLSKDGVPVVIHDEQVNRTTNRRGPVAAYTAEELGEMDAGSWFSPGFKGEPVPTLEDVLKLTAGKCRLNIELKTYGGRYPGMEAEVVKLMRRYGRVVDSVVTSFDPLALRRVKELEGAARIGLIIDAAPPGLVDGLKRLGADFLSIGYTRLNAERMQSFRSAGLQVMAWTVNEAAKIRKTAALGEDIIICTNYPDRFGDVMTGKAGLSLKGRWFR